MDRADGRLPSPRRRDDNLVRRNFLGDQGNERPTSDHPELVPIEVDCDIVTVQGVKLRVVVFSAEPDTTAAEQTQLLSVIGSQRLGTA